MKIINNAMPGYRVYEYLLVLSPHKDLREKIMKVKEHFAGTYKSMNARWSRPHITLVNFVQYAMMEDRIVNRLNTVSMGQYPFKAELKDYGSFPSHTIYINVATKVPVHSLVKTIRAEAQRLMKLNDDHKPHFIMEPHLTIARKLQPWQYEKGWQEYRHKNFTGRFIADGMLLLKRPVENSNGQPPAYQIVKHFAFQNLPVLTRQGTLFA